MSNGTILLNQWSTPNTYGKNYSPLPEKCGVYLLVRREFFINDNTRMRTKILYVGSSKNLYKRCSEHPVKTRIIKDYVGLHGFDVACYFKECENYKEEEKQLIRTSQARYNKQWR